MDDTEILAAGEGQEERQRLLAEIFTRHRARLRTIVELRMDRRLRARVDPSDILQEAYLEAARRVGEYCRSVPMPVFLWLRRLAAQRLVDLHRFHLGADRRSPGREVSIERAVGPASRTGWMARRLLAQDLSPSQAAVQEEARANLKAALDSMGDLDREVVALRHFERLSAAETAAVLGLPLETARKRYLRAMKKLRAILLSLPGRSGETRR
jgi:RNA polymerase sigma-70 factor, ECF subfamily